MRPRKRRKGERERETPPPTLSESGKKKKKARRRKRSKRVSISDEEGDLYIDAGEGEERLLITVGGGGAKSTEGSRYPHSSTFTNRYNEDLRSTLSLTPSLPQRPTSLLKTPLTPPNHTHPRGSKRPLLDAPPPMGFPREPLPPSYNHRHHPHHSPADFPQHSIEPWRAQGHASSSSPYGDTPYHRRDQKGAGLLGSPPKSQKGVWHGKEEWRHDYDGFGHTPSSGFANPRDQYSRSASLAEGSRARPVIQQRRFSDYHDRNPRHDHFSRPHSQGATPTLPDDIRGEMLSSRRGFQMSEQRAHQTGYYSSPRDRSRSQTYNSRTYNQKH